MKHDIYNFFNDNWSKMFAKASGLEGAFDATNKHLLNDKFSMDDLRLAHTALATRHATDSSVHEPLPEADGEAI